MDAARDRKWAAPRGVLVLALSLTALAGSARAQEPLAEAERLMGLARKAAKDMQPALARRYAESAYRLVQSPVILGHLASAAQEEGRIIEAGDLARRYLRLRRESDDLALLRECQVLAAAVPSAHAEIEVSGEESGLVLVDGRLAGALPHLGTLWVAPGEHLLRIEQGARSAEQTVSLRPGERLRVPLHLPPLVVLRADAPFPPDFCRPPAEVLRLAGALDGGTEGDADPLATLPQKGGVRAPPPPPRSVLPARKPQRPLIRQPWLWTLTGALLTGGVVATSLALTWPQKPPGPTVEFP
jgi:hypothetical protein